MNVRYIPRRAHYRGVHRSGYPYPRYEQDPRTEYDRYPPRQEDVYPYEEQEVESDYMEDLMEWTHKLTKKDVFNVPRHQIIEQAKSMGIKFDMYSEEEFYATYLMHVSDYKGISRNHYTYIAMAKAFLEDDDLNVTPSEKLCLYLDYIVLAPPKK